MRNYRKEYENYHSKPKQKKNRAKRNAARAEMEREGRVRKGDGKDVAHKKPLAKGGSNKRSNLKVASKSKNRSFKRTKSAGMA
jgi:5-methylcytosine-specific restriction endonuclease McrA